MVNKCFAFGCRSGYKSKKQVTEIQLDSTGHKITFHKFPKDPLLLQKWMNAIPRQDLVRPSVNARMCSCHFRASDFVTVSQDSNNKEKAELKNRYLKDDAVPSLFPNAPAYLSKKKVEQRTTSKASASSRW